MAPLSVQEPGVAVSVWPASTTPLMTGREVLTGAASAQGAVSSKAPEAQAATSPPRRQGIGRARGAPRACAPRSIECLLDIPVKTCSPGWQVPLAQQGSRQSCCLHNVCQHSVSRFFGCQQSVCLGDGAEHDGRVHGGAEGVPGGVLRERPAPARGARDVAQADLHELADLHRTQVGRMEGGDSEPRLMTLVIIADALGVKLDDLIAGLPVPKERRPPPERKPKRAKRPASK